MYEQNLSPTPSTGSLFQVFIDAVTKPSVDNYSSLLRNPLVTPNNAYIWVGLASAFSGLIFAIIGSFTYRDAVEGLGSILWVLLCTAPLSAILSIAGIAISAAAASAIARAFGGVGTYNDVISLYGAISAPMLFVNLIIGSIPFINLLAVFLGIYQLFLYIQAIRAAHKVDGLKAAISALALPAILLCCAAIFGAVVLTTFVAAFSQMSSGLLP